MTNEIDERASVAQITERLSTRYPHLDPRHVASVVAAAYDGMSTARVRDFVPVLVERQAKGLLRDEEARADRRIPA
ncbi:MULTISPECIES: three-helix bundle dimerization domain-containing protein [Microbacterium]|jgi:hypothetical protein|uniref:three-helix bundle dimerization domain-containing protein n=1 Tax=Microbacterium TaxID=33882 RepID=UPI0006FB463A|nr:MULTISPECIES: hypothetical protein [unclassified Microbacterium]MBN9199454.1 hypothetical protein [Microbacterium ginsengisoli]MCK9916963.1 hypothetical protein [Microbacteriaceae bacterium K1510]KQR90953.1 hypothetical protein ASF93_08490 [Microbacterium sp. Leaf347]KQS00048.1 hypothetical protein ASG00_11240 [Microbacterium sp. Leaf351]ODU77902.1 MAG: hypothetical protein ABT08_05525 [Microbacterium sp. SCN 71-21]